jgi:hypothetical protein
MNGIRKLLDMGVSRISNFQLMILKGTVIEQLESRQMFGFKTAFRVLPKNYGVYYGEAVFDTEEIVCATDTLPFPDYLRARRVAFFAAFFWLDPFFDEIIQLVENLGVRRSEWFDAMVVAFENGSEIIRAYLDRFNVESRNELFPSREACLEFYSTPENFERLKRGEVGDNLMHKYRAIAGFYNWSETCACIMNATRKLIEERNLGGRIFNFEEFWPDLHAYFDLRHPRGYKREELLGSHEGVLRYDIGEWLAAGMPLDTLPFRKDEPEAAEFRLSESSTHAMEAALDMWTDELRGLTRLLARIQVGAQKRECHSLRAVALRAGAA